MKNYYLRIKMKSKILVTGVMVLMIGLTGCIGGPLGGPGGGGNGGGGGGGGQNADWCDKSMAQSFGYASPQGDVSYTWKVEGVVQQEGRQVCKVILDYKETATQQGSEVGRIVYYFDEPGNYFKYEAYAPNGTKVGEYEFSGG